MADETKTTKYCTRPDEISRDSDGPAKKLRAVNCQI